MNIDEMKRSIGHLLDDRGLTTDYKEPSVRLLLYHPHVQEFVPSHWLLKRAKKKKRQRKIPPAPLL